jgi:Rieske Fe-S protein
MKAERSTISRRHALNGATTAGLGLPLLAACGDDGGGSGAEDPASSTTPRSSDAPTSGKPGKTKSSASEPAGGIPTADVPVGGGLVVSDEQVVVTQPTEGEFLAFTAVCTHAQCLVTEVTDGTINCPCHGSQYSIEDGSVAGGPAPTPLAAVKVTVDGDRVILG